MEESMSTIEYRKIEEKKQAEIVMFVVRSNSIPAGMAPKPERKEPVERVQGTVIAQSERNDVSLAATLADLEIGEYRLVSSYYEKHETRPGRRGLRDTYILTYVFAREAEGDRGSIEECFEMLTSALWQVRVYRNPLFRNGVAVPGDFTLSVNCHGRQPLYNDDGSPAMQWRPLIVDGDTVSFVPHDDELEMEFVSW